MVFSSNMAASLCSNLFNKSPIIVILGATGTGKSKLAIELALKFKGEVISADSMQVYKGLDIATNKVTKEEQKGIRHHLLGFLEPPQKLFVTDFRNLALRAIETILDQEKVPIIVGGTNYYIESVLYHVLIDAPSAGKNKTQDFDRSEEGDDFPSPKRMKKNEGEDEGEDVFLKTVEGQSNEALYDRLKEVDPELAEVIHPNNRRKVIRGLQVFHQTGQTLSALFKKQKSLPGGGAIGGPLRFSNAIILWLQCDSEVLKKRLDDRVDGMISQGLVEELLQFKTKFAEDDVSTSSDFTKGVLQTIGFKEFNEYLSCEEKIRGTEEGAKLLADGVELLKLATRQYAKRQHKWIQNRFLKNTGRQVPPIYGLDATDPAKWENDVYEKAVHLVECHLAGRKPHFDPLPVVDVRVSNDKCYPCDVCNKIVMGEKQWEAHIKGQKHRTAVKKLRESQKVSGSDEKPGETLPTLTGENESEKRSEHGRTT